MNYSILESLAELHDITLIEPHAEYSAYSRKAQYPVSRSSGYGDWDTLKSHSPINPETVYVMTRYTGGSDYSGNLVEVSNHKAILALLPDDYEDGTDYIEYSGGYGTFDIAIRLDRLTEELLEAFGSLEGYPLLDESLHSELETESQNEAWETGGIKTDFQRALGQCLWSIFETSTAANQRDDETDTAHAERMELAETFLSDDCGNIGDTDLSALCWQMADLANEYWSNESGSGSWLDVDAVVNNSIGSKRRSASDWQVKAHNEICALIRSAMSDDKYTLGIVRYVNPNQFILNFVEEL